MKWITGSLQNKLLAVTGSGTALLLAAVSFGFWLLWSSVAGYSHLLEVPVANERDVQELSARLDRQIITWKNLLLRTDDKAALKAHSAEFDAESRAVETAAKGLLARLDSGQAHKYLQSFLPAYQKMLKAFHSGMNEFEANYFSPKVGDQAVKGAEVEPVQLLQKAQASLVRNANAAAAANRQRARHGLVISIVLVAVVLLIAFVVTTMLIRRNIVTPAKRLEADLSRMARGDFSLPVACTTTDELGHVASSAQKLQVELGKLMQEVAVSATQLSTAAEQTLVVAEQTSSNVDQQQSRTRQVATAIEQMASTSQEVARNTTDAAAAAKDAERQTDSGLTVVGAAITAIESLAAEVVKTVDIIHRVSNDSDSIGSVLEVIRNISEQTNLLALNAAIEAARAGEQGRGFSVVADEVRSLAQRTQKSTHEIQQTIERLHAGVDEAVNVMGHGQEQARASLQHGADAKQSLAAIESAVHTINNMNTQIASATEQQTAVAEEINRHISEIKGGADENAESARQIAQSSEGLTELAGRLQQVMTRFKIA